MMRRILALLVVFSLCQYETTARGWQSAADNAARCRKAVTVYLDASGSMTLGRNPSIIGMARTLDRLLHEDGQFLSVGDRIEIVVFGADLEAAFRTETVQAETYARLSDFLKGLERPAQRAQWASLQKFTDFDVVLHDIAGRLPPRGVDYEVFIVASDLAHDQLNSCDLEARRNDFAEKWNRFSGDQRVTRAFTPKEATPEAQLLLLQLPVSRDASTKCAVQDEEIAKTVLASAKQLKAEALAFQATNPVQMARDIRNAFLQKVSFRIDADHPPDPEASPTLTLTAHNDNCFQITVLGVQAVAVTGGSPQGSEATDRMTITLPKPVAVPPRGNQTITVETARLKGYGDSAIELRPLLADPTVPTEDADVPIGDWVRVRNLRPFLFQRAGMDDWLLLEVDLDVHAKQAHQYRISFKDDRVRDGVAGQDFQIGASDGNGTLERRKVVIRVTGAGLDLTPYAGKPIKEPTFRGLSERDRVLPHTTTVRPETPAAKLRPTTEDTQLPSEPAKLTAAARLEEFYMPIRLVAVLAALVELVRQRRVAAFANMFATVQESVLFFVFVVTNVKGAFFFGAQPAVSTLPLLWHVLAEATLTVVAFMLAGRYVALAYWWPRQEQRLLAPETALGLRTRMAMFVTAVALLAGVIHFAAYYFAGFDLHAIFVQGAR